MNRRHLARVLGVAVSLLLLTLFSVASGADSTCSGEGNPLCLNISGLNKPMKGAEIGKRLLARSSVTHAKKGDRVRTNFALVEDGKLTKVWTSDIALDCFPTGRWPEQVAREKAFPSGDTFFPSSDTFFPSSDTFYVFPSLSAGAFDKSAARVADQAWQQSKLDKGDLLVLVAVTHAGDKKRQSLLTAVPLERRR